MDSLIILVLEIMTLKEKYNKMSEIIFCLGSHASCNTGKTGSGESSGDGEGAMGCGPACSSPLAVGERGLAEGSSSALLPEKLQCAVYFLRCSSNPISSIFLMIFKNLNRQ